jgi:4Fe-4S ferredoxin
MDYGGNNMNESVFQTKDDKQLVYIPDKCIGCGTCVMACPKESLVIGSVGAIARGLIDRDFLENNRDTCNVCGMCTKVCPTGALEMRLDGNPVKDETYLCGALKPTTVSDDCVHCGLCEQVCPQGCITVKWRLANDGSTSIEGETIIDKESCVHCGWCESVCPVNAITVEKPFAGEWKTDEDVCQTCRTCIDVCPCNAIFARKWGPGERVEKITQRPDACIYCGACAISCPVDAITVTKNAIVPEMSKKKPYEKKITGIPTPRPMQTSTLVTDEDSCLGCGNCVIVCPVNALSDPYLASGHLNELDSKPLLEVLNGVITVYNHEFCGNCGSCVMICPVNAINLTKKEVE